MRRVHSDFKRVRLTSGHMVSLWWHFTDILVDPCCCARGAPRCALNVLVIKAPKCPIVVSKYPMHICRIEKTCSACIDWDGQSIRLLTTECGH